MVQCDMVISNGVVIDGTGKSCIKMDVAIQDGKISGMGKYGGNAGKNRMDAKGKVLCPGFIDGHAHSEIQVWQEESLAKLSQGITTELAGQCGISPFPIKNDKLDSISNYVAPILGKAHCSWPWRSLESYRQEIYKKGLAINQGNFIGHGTLRINSLNFDNRPATSVELSEMKSLLARELVAGALGLSSGLAYAPGIFSSIGEMVELARVCARFGGIYTTHMRHEGSELLESIEEALEVARLSGVQLVLSHLKASGKPNHGKVKLALERLDQAVASGLKVYGDCYPYTTASTTLTIVLPNWTLENGIGGLMELLKEPSAREKMKQDYRQGLAGWENRAKTLGWDNIIIASISTEKNKLWEGLSLYEIGKRQQKSAEDALFDLLLEEEGNITALLKGMAEEDVRAALNHPRIMVCSDGIPVGNKPHPRLYGAFTRYLSKYVDLSSVEALVKAIHKLTGMPAEVYGLKKIGNLAEGYWADILILDPGNLQDKATFSQPTQLSQGIETVLVSGQVVYENGACTGAVPGRFW